MLIALTRAVPPTLAACELTHRDRTRIDIDAAVMEHEAYEDALRTLGCRVERLEPAPEHPDSVFIEDAALVFDEIAVLTRPGAPSRRGEVQSVGEALARFRPVCVVEPPGTMDGGDVLRVGRRVFVGMSSRTNADALRQLEAILPPLGYRVEPVPVSRCLHLKSAVTEAADGLLVLNPEWIDRGAFSGLAVIDVDPQEPFAANVLRVGDAVLCAAAAPRTRRLMEARGLAVHAVPTSELAKAEGALTCCSLLFPEDPR